MKSDKNFKEFDKAKSIAILLAERVKGKEVNDDAVVEWLNEDDYRIAMMRKLSDKTNIEAAYNEFDEMEKEREHNIRRIVLNATTQKIAKRKIVIIRTVISSCAAVFSVISLLVYNNNQEEKPRTSVYETDLLEKPTLILSSGKSIDLKAQNENIIDNKTVINKDKNSLNYKTPLDNESEDENFHTLIIPRLQTYSVTLYDGTEVILNANSELRYPTIFKGETRSVQLKGEAYFKVSKTTKRFIVNVNGADIKVYGTEFNINSHIGNRIYTTLISGSLGVSIQTSKEVIMKPNQLSVVNLSENSCTVSDVTVSQYVSWMSGDFIYEDANVVAMLDDVAAWYGVEIQYDAIKFSNITINAAFSRKEPLAKIIKAIGEITNVKFVKINQNKYVIE